MTLLLLISCRRRIIGMGLVISLYLFASALYSISSTASGNKGVAARRRSSIDISPPSIQQQQPSRMLHPRNLQERNGIHLQNSAKKNLLSFLVLSLAGGIWFPGGWTAILKLSYLAWGFPCPVSRP
jgi:hypothetical protein